MGKHKFSIMGHLKRAVKKIRFLLNVDKSRWRLFSILHGASKNKRRLSFNDRMSLGLRQVFSEDDESSSSGRQLHRSRSCISNDQDVDRRAEIFIANFYGQLRMERNVSLELRYCRGYSFEKDYNSSSPST